MVVRKKDGNTSTKIPVRPILGFRDNKKIREISNKVIPLVITTIISNFGVSILLINCGTSYDIMYSYLYKKMG